VSVNLVFLIFRLPDPNPNSESQMWWHTHMIQALGMLRQEDHELQVSLGYLVRPCLRAKRENRGEGA
jgi:hypothetical protein